MPKKLTQEEVIMRCKKLYGELYDYSYIQYVNNRTPIKVFCNKHAIFFFPFPDDFMLGHRCPMCGKESTKKIRYGFGYDDTLYNHGTKAHRTWSSMISRCYNPEFIKKAKTYMDCSVCEEWKYFSNFKKWFDENYVEGYHLDKDILVKGNKVYSPQTCCFVPQEINNQFITRRNCRGELPIGVTKNGRKYKATVSFLCKMIVVGYSYSTPEAAFLAYKKAKEQYVKVLAEKYYKEGKITERVYNALLAYEVEITD